MSMFAALKSDDSEENYIEELPSLEKLTPQYTIQQILNLYKDSPKDPNLIGESYQQKKFEKLFVKGAQPPECFSFKPPSSEINSPIFLGSSSGKNFQRQNQQQQKKHNLINHQKYHYIRHSLRPKPHKTIHTGQRQNICNNKD